MDPISLFLSGLQSIFIFADFAIRINDVSSENEVFVRTIQVVRNDLNETERLLGIRSIQTKLISTPQKLEWIKAAIYSTKFALNEIGKWVERARVDQEILGKVKFENKVRWIFNDQDKLLSRKTELSACHQQLSNVLTFLVPLEEVAAGEEPPTYHATTFFDDMVSPRQQRKTRSNEMASGAQSRAVLDYFPSTTVPTGHASSVASNTSALATHMSPNDQRRPEKSSPTPYNNSPEANAPPPEYIAYEETVSDGMRYDGSYAADSSTTLQQNNLPVYSQAPSRESNPEDLKMNDHKDRKQQLSLSHTRSLAIRGSNRYGPVDQFELFTESIVEKQKSNPQTTNTSGHDISARLKTMIIDDTPIPVEDPSVLSSGLAKVNPTQLPAELPVELPSKLPSELPSDPSSKLPSNPHSELPSELHSKLPTRRPSGLHSAVPSDLPIVKSGPLPGYLQAVTRKPVPELASYVAYRPEAPKPQQQAKPAPRPPPKILHSNSMPTTSTTQTRSFRYEMEDATSSVSLLLPPRSTSTSSVSNVPPPLLSSKTSSFSRQQSDPSQRTLHSSYSSVSLISESSSDNAQLLSPWSTSTNLASTAPSPMSSPSLSCSTPSTSKWQTSRVRPSTGPQTLSSTRMRNQKSYMDLLGSIDKKR